MGKVGEQYKDDIISGSSVFKRPLMSGGTCTKIATGRVRVWVGREL